MNRKHLLSLFITLCWMAQPSIALVNPSLQPGELFDRHTTVLSLKVVNIDDAKKTASLSVQTIYKGEFAPKVVTLTAIGDGMNEAFIKVLNKGTTVTAFIGLPRKPLIFDFYAGADGRWQGGELASADKPELWNWSRDYSQHELFGTFNGHPDRLADMMADKAAGTLYFPALIFDQFKDDLEIGKLAQPIRGVAMYDFDGDGRSDLYACSAGGDRLYLQTAPMVFTEKTKQFGLGGAASASVNVADVDADGLPDLLLDGVIWKQSADHHFTKSDLLPASVNADVKCSAFIDVNRDGYPDVLVSRSQGGLTLLLNPGKTGGPFIDATHTFGLDKPECGAGGTGWIMWGDWDGKGYPAIFYSSGSGFLLTQKTPGAYVPTPEPLAYDFTADGAESGRSGAGCFAPVWKPDHADLLFARDTAQSLIINDNGKLLDGVPYGNEIQMGTIDQLGMLAEDLNADGNVDLYIGSRSGKSNMYLMNRGYGTFMTPDRYRPQVFPSDAHRHGAWGIAAGDVDGDGANDLLIGGDDAKLTLIPNNVLAARQGKQHPTAADAKLEQTVIFSVHVTGKLGVLGARVSIADEHGKVVGFREIGANVVTGCRGPDTVNLAVREPGNYVATVVYSDGQTKSWPLSWPGEGKDKHVIVSAARESPSTN